MLTLLLAGRFGESIDPDARLLIDAVEGGGDITTPLQRKKINAVFRGLKSAGLYDKIRAMYLFFALPATGTGRRWNSVDPRDLDAAYRLTFVGSPTHSSDAVAWNGVNQYANTHAPANAAMEQNSAHMAYYSTSESVGGQWVEMGWNNGANSRGFICPNWSANRAEVGIQEPVATKTVNINPEGLFVASRIDSSGSNLSRNGIVVQSTNTASAAPVSFGVFIGCYNGLGGANGSPARYTARPCAFASLGLGFTEAETAVFNTIIQNAMSL